MLGVLERRGEDVDLWWWWGWRCLGERERRWRGLGVVDGYGRRGERGARRGLWGEEEVDVGRRWRAWRRQGGAGAVVAGAGGGGRVRPVGGGGGGHGAAVALVVAPRGAGAARAGSQGVLVAPGGAGAVRVGG